MQALKKITKRTLLSVALLGCLLTGSLIIYLITSRSMPISPPPLSEAVVAESLPALTSFGMPVRLKIPSIGVDAVVETVGLTSDGAMDVPKGWANVAWYKLGQRPGEIGSAVMDGHYGIKNGKALVFENLHKLQPGDKLFVEDANGATVTFVVSKSQLYEPEAVAPEVFSSTDNLAHLNLITCEGTWDKVASNYSKRLVVFADKE